MSKPIEHPRPGVNEDSRAYWEAAGRNELVFQRCADCGVLRHPPRAICPDCLSGGIEWLRSSGRGTVHTYTITNQNHARGFRDAVPYVLAYVELEEGVRLLTNVVGCTPDEVEIGMPVQAEFADPEALIAIPRFRPA